MSIAIYPGSFDPPTLGHMDIIKRSAARFDDVVVCVMNDGKKSSQMFAVHERIELLKTAVSGIPNVSVAAYSGLLSDYIKEFDRPVIIRGLRAITDFEYEFQMALVNKKLNPMLETMFMVADEKYAYLSSSAVRELAKFNADLTGFVPVKIVNAIKSKVNERGEQIIKPENIRKNSANALLAFHESA